MLLRRKAGVKAANIWKAHMFWIAWRLSETTNPFTQCQCDKFWKINVEKLPAKSSIWVRLLESTHRHIMFYSRFYRRCPQQWIWRILHLNVPVSYQFVTECHSDYRKVNSVFSTCTAEEEGLEDSNELLQAYCQPWLICAYNFGSGNSCAFRCFWWRNWTRLDDARESWHG